MRTKAIFAAMVLALVPLPSVAQDFDVGLAAYQRGDYATMLEEWKPLADQGDALTQFNLGVLYANGRGVAQDFTEAVRLFSAAAEQGSAFAQYNLGLMYGNGQGVLQDYVKAHQWFNISAASGIEKAVEKAIESRERVAELMTTADISEAQRLARICMESNYQDCG